MAPSETYIPAVREQYEDYPYPPRDPEEERRRLILTEINDINRVNFYCFSGREDFNQVSILDAGGGTGDSTIQWAERLRGTHAKVVYLDISTSSAAIAKRRAEIRNLDNITWLQGSIDELPRLGVGPFDLIICTGVLHHLHDPKAGLLALLEVLKPRGSLGLMLYAKYGRAPIYQIQELMGLVNQGVSGARERIANTRKILASLPPRHAFKQNEAYYGDYLTLGDAGIYDLFLHAKDQAFTIAGVHRLLRACGLHLSEFSTPKYRLLYRPETIVRDPELLERIHSFPIPVQQHIAEIIVGLIGMHEFYASRHEDTVASITDTGNVPYLYPRHTWPIVQEIAQRMIATSTAEVPARHPTGFQFRLPANACAGHVLLRVDGKRTLEQIFQAVRNEEPRFSSMTSDAFLQAFTPVFENFRLLDWLMLRHHSAPEFDDPDTLQRRLATSRRGAG